MHPISNDVNGGIQARIKANLSVRQLPKHRRTEKSMSKERTAGWEIVIGGREVKWPKNEISYEEVKSKWDELRGDQTIIGNPPIKFKRENGETGLLRPNEKVKVEDGFEIIVEPSHLS